MGVVSTPRQERYIFTMDYGNPDEKKAEDGNKWQDLLYNFTQDTTLHGIRYVTVRHEHWLRRVIWVLVLLVAFGVFMGIIISNIVRLNSHPMTVNINMAYKNNLPFPAITICNHNMFRLTQAFEAGLYDIIENKFQSKSSAKSKTSTADGKTSNCEPFPLMTSWCPSLNSQLSENWDKSTVHYKRVTLKGCQRLCEEVHDDLCHIVQYNWHTKTCIISAPEPDHLADLNYKRLCEDANITGPPSNITGDITEPRVNDTETNGGSVRDTGPGPNNGVSVGDADLGPNNGDLQAVDKASMAGDTEVNNGGSAANSNGPGAESDTATSSPAGFRGSGFGSESLPDKDSTFNRTGVNSLGGGENSNCLNSSTNRSSSGPYGCRNRSATIEVYKRNRCLEVLTNISCDWEKDGCPFMADNTTTTLTESFLVVTAKDNIPTADHTVQTGRGRYLWLTRTARFPVRSQAAITTRYLHLQRHCAEFYYQQTGMVPVGLELLAIGEDHTRKMLWPVNGGYRLSHLWNRVFVELPDGVFRLELRTVRPAGHVSGVAVDDLTVWPCDRYSEDCKRTSLGAEYQGPRSVTADGSSCYSGSPCRNAHGKTTGPECEVYTQSGYLTTKTCTISFCACRKDQLTCGDGMCLPDRLACDGHRDCPDGMDEWSLCDEKRNINCEFDDPYNCGYMVSEPWVRTRPIEAQSLTGEKIKLDHNHSTLGYYMNFDTSRSQEGDRSFLTSAPHKGAGSACLSFSIYMPSNYDGHFRLLLAPCRLCAHVLLQDIWAVDVKGRWVEHSVSLPPGDYSVVFEAAAGSPFRSDVAIDNVSVSDRKDCGKQPDRGILKPKDFDSSCRLSPKSICGYSNSSTTSKASWTLYPEQFIYYPSDTNSLNSEGWVQSPNYPDIYNDDVYKNYVIKATGADSKIHIEFLDFQTRLCCDEIIVTGNYNFTTSLFGQLSDINTTLTIIGTMANISLKTSDDIYYLKFRARYWIEYPQNTSFMLGLQVLEGVVSDRDHTVTLTTPIITVHDTSCMQLIVRTKGQMTVSYFRTQDNIITRLQTVSETSFPQSIKADLPHGRMQVLFDVTVLLDGVQHLYTYISNIQIYNTTCIEQIDNSVNNLQCNFTGFTDCGYRDISRSSTRWTLWAASEARNLISQYNSYKCNAHDSSRTASFSSSYGVTDSYSSSYNSMSYSSYSTTTSFTTTPYNSMSPTSSTTAPTYSPVLSTPSTSSSPASFTSSGSYSATASYPSYRSIDAVYVCNNFYDFAECTLKSPPVAPTSRGCLTINVTFYACSYTQGQLLFVMGDLDNQPSYLGETALNHSIEYQVIKLNVEPNKGPPGQAPPGETPPGDGRPGQGPPEPSSQNTAIQILATTYRGTFIFYNIDFSLGECSAMGDSAMNITKRPPPATVAPTGSTGGQSDQSSTTATNEAGGELNNSTHPDRVPVRRTIADDISQKGFIYKAGHRHDDLFHRCKWYGADCDPGDFVQELTDMGLCYTFNPNNHSALHSNATGSDYGLKLTLNLETYERMSGPNTDIGVKIHLHNQTNLPLISETGFAAPVGLHSLLSIKYSQVINLGSPYGDCGPQPLPLYPGLTYSFQRCQAQCKAVTAARDCSCLAAHMPAYEGFKGCSMKKYFSCLLGNNSVTGNPGSKCNCTNACTIFAYDIQSSFSKIDMVDFDMGRTKVGQEYQHALETRHRADPERLVRTIHLFRSLLTSGYVYMHAAQGQATLTAASTFTVAQNALQQIRRVSENATKTVLEELSSLRPAYSVVYGSRRAMLELLLGEIAATLGIGLQMKAGPPGGGGPAAAGTQGEAAGAARSPVGQRVDPISHVFSTASIAVHVLSGMISDEYNQFIGPITEFASSTDIDLSAIPKVIHVRTLSGNSNFNSSNASPSSPYNTTLVFLQELLDEDPDSWSTHNLTTLFLAASARIAELTIHMKEFPTVLDEVDRLTATVCKKLSSQIGDSLYNIEFNFEQESQAVNDVLKKYKYMADKYYEASKGKLALAEFLSAEEVDNTLSELRGLQNRLKTKLRDRLKEAANKLESYILESYTDVVRLLARLQPYYDVRDRDMEEVARTMSVWRSPQLAAQSDPVISMPYQDSKHMWPPNRNLRSFVEDGSASRTIRMILKDFFDPVRRILDEVCDELDYKVSQIQLLANDLKADSSNFKVQAATDATFIQSNFLNVDIYYGELKMQVIEQKASYTMTDFWSDLGGYLGLLLGASVVTICEFLDLVFFNGLRMIRKRAKVHDTPIITIDDKKKGEWDTISHR